ncbi:type I polyketide synthase [Chondromyces crocatus]|uniref:type I polyketide synthase n=1 Tax=Chondromyces crocatus TaxID=52 RepID=UPI00067BA479|nr:type I polyketide synthase [Chondromyces crocatus]
MVRRLSELRGLDVSAIDVRVPFSRYGLESIGAAKLVDDLSAALGRRLSPTLTWEHPSIEALARHLSGASTAPAPRVAQALRPQAEEPIAIVGMACRVPGAAEPEAFWGLLSGGVDAVSRAPSERWPPEARHAPVGTTAVDPRQGGFLDHVDGFEPLFFGISPREAAEMDPQQRLVLELSWEALEDAGIPARRLQGSMTGVFVGVAWADYATLQYRSGRVFDQHTVPGFHHSIVANRVSYVFGLEGPSMAVDTACSSSLVAVHLACESLRRGESTLAIAGGVNLNLVEDSAIGVGKLGALSPDGRCFSFDARANGYVRGEGAGVVVLKPLSRALADGDAIHALILGGAVNSDGASNGLTAPNPRAQENVLRLACARAGVAPVEIDYVEAHGTGTPLGDTIEASALGAVLGRGRSPERPLLLGSVKTNIGHLEAAAGIVSLIKVALGLRQRLIPPSLNYAEPNPLVPFEALRLQVVQQLTPWPLRERPARAGVSAFGFGGTNCHLVLEAWAPGGDEEAPSSPEVMSTAAGQALPVVEGAPRQAPPVVFVFSGQGSQWPGMGRALLRDEPVFRTTFAACDRVVQQLMGFSLIDQLLADERSSRLEEAEVACPAIVAFQIALAALWRAWGVEPVAVVGHSSGEIAAAQVASALDLEDAMRVTCMHGRLLARIRGQGALGVVALSWDEAGEAIRAHRGLLSRAIHASPGEVVLAGDPGALDEVFAALEQRRIFCRRIQMDSAPHSPQIDPLRGELLDALRAVHPHPAAIPMFSSVTGAKIEGERLDALHWTKNLGEPVRFAEAIQAMDPSGAVFLEISPHPLVGRAIAANLEASGRTCAVLRSLRRGEVDERAALRSSLEQLMALSQPVSRRAAAQIPGGAGPRFHPGGWHALPEDAEAFDEDDPRILPLSAKSREALVALARAHRRALEGDEASDGALPSLGDVVYTAGVRREHHAHRLAAVGACRDDLRASLDTFLRNEPTASTGRGRALEGPLPVVLVFPGQGSQWLGMGRELLRHEPSFRAAIEVCDRAIHREAGWSLLDELWADAPRSGLDRINIVQPALFALQVALAALWRAWGILPDAVIGHSMGEVAAAHVAGALSLVDATRIICRRSALLRRLSGRGAMALVELGLAQARDALGPHADRIAVAVSNSPRSTALAGEPEALEQVLSTLTQAGVFVRRINVDVASHSPQMDALLPDLRAALAPITPFAVRIPMRSTVTGEECTGSDLDGDYWARNLRAPVLFHQAIARTLARGPALFIEVSPHPVLVPAMEEALQEGPRGGVVVGSLRRGQGARQSLLESLGALYAAGHPVDFSRLYRAGGRVVRLPSYPFQRQRYWFDLDAGRALGVGGQPDVRLRDHIEGAPAAERQRLVEEAIGAHISHVLRLSPEAIDVTEPLRTLGVDSLIAMEVRNRILTELRVELFVSRVLLADGIRQLAREVLDRMQLPEATAVDAATTLRTMEEGEL